MSDLSAGNSVFFDSNALILAFEAGSSWSSAIGLLLSEIESGKRRGVLSELSLGEVLVKPLAAGAVEHVVFYESLFAADGPFDVRTVDRPIIRRSAGLQAETGLKLADALLVATAIEAGCDHFLTADVRLGRKLGNGITWLRPEDLPPGDNR